jgi:polar amino acid transport system substrate-binding protein
VIVARSADKNRLKVIVDLFVRMTLQYPLVWLALLLSLAPHPALAAGQVIQVNVDAANPPFMYGSPTAARGLYPSLLTTVFDRIGEPVAVSAVPWRRALLEIDAGRAGIGGIYKTTEREKKYDYSDALFVERIGVYYNRKKPIDFTADSDLHGLRIGVILGWSYGEEFDAARNAGEIIADAVPTDLQNLRKLDLGRIDAALVIVDAADPLLSEGRFPHIVRAGRLLAEKPTYLAFNKQADKALLLARFNKALAEIRADGTYARLVSRELARP